MKYLLQEYDDQTFGYLGIDGDDKHKFENYANVLHTQRPDQKREDFIKKYDIEFQPNQYGSDLELDQKIQDPYVGTRADVATVRYGLDKLIHDPDEYVRSVVAQQDYKLDILVKDPDYRVRRTIAAMGKYLDVLVKDQDSRVLQQVLTTAIFFKDDDIINQLINNNNTMIRNTIFEYAMQNQKQNMIKRFVTSDNYMTRCTAAKYGYSLDILIHDPSKDVVHTVNWYLSKNNLSLDQWILQHTQ